MNKKTRNKILGTSALFLASIVWGFAFIGQVSASKSVEPFTFNFSRSLIGALIILPFAAIVYRKERKEDRVPKENWQTLLIHAGITGFVFFLGANLQQYGAQITSSAGVSGFITGFYIVLTPIFYFLIFRRGLSKWNVIAALFAFSGLVLISLHSGDAFKVGKGEIFLFIGSIFWAFHVLSIDYFGKSHHVLFFAGVQYLFSAFYAGICMLLFEHPSWQGILDAKYGILYCGIFSTAIGFTLQMYGQKYTNPTAAVTILSIETIVSALGGVIFGIDHLSWVAYIGMGIILVGILLTQLHEVIFKKKPKPAPDDASLKETSDIAQTDEKKTDSE